MPPPISPKLRPFFPLQDNFNITAAQLFNIDRAAAAEFLEVYKGVLPAGEFNAMIEELTSGPCIAVEVADKDRADPVEPLRQLAGPMDPELGRVLRPQSLRAKFGLNKIKNGVHVTDLPVSMHACVQLDGIFREICEERDCIGRVGHVAIWWEMQIRVDIMKIRCWLW